jgi:hypothetical protein
LAFAASEAFKNAKMEIFKSNYLAKCKDLNIDTNATIMETIYKYNANESKSAFVSLDLSGQAINFKSCSALAFALTGDVVFSKLILSDAFIGDDGGLSFF